MKFLLFLVVFVCTNCLVTILHSQDYFVAFCSKEASYNSLGHAFIAIGQGDTFTCDIDGGDGECWGLYAGNQIDGDCIPRGFDVLKSYFFGKLPGCLYNDIQTNVSNFLEVSCTFDEYLTAKGVIDDWKTRDYEISLNDCLSFLVEVASIFDERILLPERSGYNNFPNKYVQDLIRLNE